MTLDQPTRPRLREKLTKPARITPDTPAPTPTPPRLPGRRNPRWVALGIVAVCLGGLLSYLICSRVASETAVLTVTRTIHRGEAVAASDLSVIKVSGSPGLETVPAAQLSAVTGKRATVDVMAGSLLPPGALADVVVPDRGRTVVGIKLAQGRGPADLLATGAHVRLVALPPSQGAQGDRNEYASKTYFGRVVSQAGGADGTSTLVNVDVSAAEAPDIAMLAAQDRVAVLRDSDR